MAAPLKRSPLEFYRYSNKNNYDSSKFNSKLSSKLSNRSFSCKSNNGKTNSNFWCVYFKNVSTKISQRTLRVRCETWRYHRNLAPTETSWQT